MNRNNPQNPIYKPLWRRISVVTVVALWLVYEALVSHDPPWIAVATVMLGYGVWVLFISWPKDDVGHLS